MNRALLFLIHLVAIGFCGTEVRGASWKMLPGHVPQITARLTAKGELPATNELRLAIGLPLRHPADLEKFLAQVYDPASPNFRQYLTPAEFTARFGPTAADYAAVKNFARTNGLAIVGTSGNRLLLDVTGPAAAVEKAFQVTLRIYHHPTENRDFFAPATEPRVAAQLPIADVSGLSDFSRPYSNLRRRPATAVARLGSAANGTYLGNDFRAAYVPGSALNGAGQAVGLMQFDGYYSNDIAAYASLAGQANVPIQTILLDGFNGVPTTGADTGNPEVSLDIEMAMAMAPGLSKIILFEGNPSPSKFIPNDVLNSMAANSTVKNLSSSWGWTGGPDTTTDNIFKQMAAQGQTYFSASGDSDAFPAKYVDDADNASQPGSSPYIVQVGGTTLATAAAGGAYSAETVWNWGYVSDNDAYEGSSGGSSSHYSIPTWQQGINSFLNNGGSTTMRNIPDVAMVSDNIYVKYGNGSHGTFGGTSCAAPLWAGFNALVNQQAAADGKPPVGFINPAVYELANESISPSVFHDVTAGDNTSDVSPGAFFAVPGYDLCTGIGTPNGTNLINALLHPDPLLVTANFGFTANRSGHGAFDLSSQTFQLTNAGASTLAWSLINTSTWLNVSAAGGTLAAGAGGAVIVSLNSIATNLDAGVYTANLWFSNVTSRVGHARLFTLRVDQSLVQNGGFEAGDFTDWTLAGNTTIGTYIYNAVVDSNDFPEAVHSGNDGAFLGDTGLATLAQSIPTVAGQSYWLSFWLNNPASLPTQQFQVSWRGSTLYSVVNPPAFGWTNFNFIVNASSANTTLQFAAENGQNYFGLDDVSLVPGFAPAISISPTNQIVSAGGNAVFHAVTGGSPAPVLHWQKNGINLANGAGISGSTASVLTLSAVTTNRTGSYTLLATNIFGATTSGVVTLTVVPPPTISISPTNQMVLAGGQAVFNATVTSSTALAYQWRQNGTNLANGAGISGAATNVLTLANLTTNRTGSYTLLVTNIFGATTSDAATLTVVLPPAIAGVAANPNGGVTLNLAGSPGVPYVLETTTNLMAGAGWQPLATNVISPNGLWIFNAPAANLPEQFYRLKFSQ